MMFASRRAETVLRTLLPARYLYAHLFEFPQTAPRSRKAVHVFGTAVSCSTTCDNVVPLEFVDLLGGFRSFKSRRRTLHSQCMALCVLSFSLYASPRLPILSRLKCRDIFSLSLSCSFLDISALWIFRARLRSSQGSRVSGRRICLLVYRALSLSLSPYVCFLCGM